MARVTIVGAGLAGSEAAYQLASRQIPVRLCEMRPRTMTQAHTTADFAEIVCSNSLGSDEPGTAAALLKEEIRSLGSLLLRIADSVRIPAGKALAVDRRGFSLGVTEAVGSMDLVEIVNEEVTAVPDPPAIIASGPLTSDRLAAALQDLTGKQNLSFYDASSPIVLAESIDIARVFRASRYDRGSDYLNCPMNRDQYLPFREALLQGQKAEVHEFDKIPYFEGCLPIEELAARGEDTMRFGPMKPVGLIDPRTGERPYAVVQLRQDDLAADHYNLVGFQTRLKWGEQRRIFGMIPGLERAEFVRHGRVHRNTYINSPALLDPFFETRRKAALFIIGTLAGVEGYVECVASAVVAATRLAAALDGHNITPPPPTTALGALGRYISSADWKNYQPINFSFGLLDPLARQIRNRDGRRAALVERARQDLARWIHENRLQPATRQGRP
ncbi:MAG: methylenetetrahydrofolate--tRNA-(uracil(54)-C(5))-methyltransferase (FADH(2)-oxidizing) TrmFO [Acidobacteriota bacterium]